MLTKNYVHRMLTYADDRGERHRVRDLEIIAWQQPLIVLGEPGMGKTYLLRRLGEETGCVFRSASSFMAHPNPAELVPPEGRLFIDGLDELAAEKESDPVYRVLGQLIKAGSPPFVLSCRAAEWRGAVARQDIKDEYPVAPRELHLEPFSRKEAVAFLTPELGPDHAGELVAYLERMAVPDLYGNPLTLWLFGQVRTQSTDLPKTRAELLNRAVEIMRREMNDRKDRSALAAMSQVTALRAAGAVCAAYVLTSSQVISLKPSRSGETSVLPISELSGFADSGAARAIIGSRLFVQVPEPEGGFKPIHRSIAEYVGARWLSNAAPDNMTVERVLAMMTIENGVPASLRGIFAWLAQDDRFAGSVIRTDPYAVLRYGDADGLSLVQARQLLDSLRSLERENPYFRSEDWGQHSAQGLARVELLEPMLAAIVARETGFHLRTLLLGIVKGSALAKPLAPELIRILIDEKARFALSERDHAAEALLALEGELIDWSAILEQLVAQGGEDATRLALDLMVDRKLEKVTDDQIGRTILAHLGLLDNPSGHEAETHAMGALFRIARELPLERIPAVLDAIAHHLRHDQTSGQHREHLELSNTITRMLSRLVKASAPEPLALLRWLRIAPGRPGYSREDREALTSFIAQATDLRRAIQRQVIFCERGQENIWQCQWRLHQLNPALDPSADDVITLLREIAEDTFQNLAREQIWRELTSFAWRFEDRREDVIAAAKPFAAGKSDFEEHLVDLTIPHPRREWEIKQEKRRTREAARKEASRAKHRRDFSDNAQALRAGDLRWSYPVAQVYLGMFSDIEHSLPPAERVGDWLGPELQADAIAGLAAVLIRPDLPALEDIAESYAQSRRWNFVFPMIAGVVDHIRRGEDLGAIPIDVVIAVRIALQNEQIGERIDEDKIETALDVFLRRDPATYERYVRLLIEPGLQQHQRHIAGLYAFVRSDLDRPFAAKLALEWLERLTDLPADVELELIDVAFEAGEHQALKALSRQRQSAGFDADERRLNWQALQLQVDFDSAAAAIGKLRLDERDFIWRLRHRLSGGRHDERAALAVPLRITAWAIKQLRPLWPRTNRPSGVTTGDTNPWNASDFIGGLINRLAADPSEEASTLLDDLVAIEPDSYTDALRHAREEQLRTRREARFQGITLERLSAVIEVKPPRTSDDLLAILKYGLRRIQAELRGNDTDAIVKYWRDDGQPRNEDRCTYALVDDLARVLPSGIRRAPQAAMPKGKIADILYEAEGEAALPIECKGQWNPKLWSAASEQLDTFYLRDWRAGDRGVYLVYWFGEAVDVNFRLKGPPDGSGRPPTPEELKKRLVASLPAARRGSIWVEILDLTR